MSDPVLARLAETRAEILDRLFALIRAPSVSADPAYAAGMAEARRLLTDRLTQAGFARVQELDGGGHPAVYGEWCEAPGRPTYLVYGHYDVQPPEPLDLWRSPPFSPEIRDGRLYGRGVADDKGPMSVALETLAAFLAVEGRLPVNVKLLLEGEEEVGSASLGALCDRWHGLLQADAVLSADGARWRADLPTVNVGTRGNTGFEVTVRTAVKDLHSGRYGGAVPNALHVIAELLASLRTEDGGFAVEGFLDDALPPSPHEREAMAAIPFDDKGFFEGLGTAPAGEPGFSTLERLWWRPTIEVNGLWGGYTGAGAKTVVPNEAHAKITLRTAPGQDPDRARAAVIAHLERRCPPGAGLEVTDLREGAAAYTVPADHPLLLAAEASLETLHGRKPIRVRMGASLPLTDIVARHLGLDTVMFSFATADEDYHAPNEFFRLSSLDEGFAAWTNLLRRL